MQQFQYGQASAPAAKLYVRSKNMNNVLKRLAQLSGWPAALVIVGAFLVTECAPLILGIGERSVVDWSFAYVTMRFILLPAASIIHVVANFIRAFIKHESTPRARIISMSSAALTGTLLYILFAHPLPLFA